MSEEETTPADGGDFESEEPIRIGAPLDGEDGEDGDERPRGVAGPPGPQDLSRERALRGCVRIDHLGAARPCIAQVVLLSRLGQGGMGVVYYGVHRRLGTEVAVKVLPSALANRSQAFVDRFLREARYAAQLSSDHLVGVLAVGEDPGSGCHYIVMEYVRGLDAGEWRRRAGPEVGAPEAEALALCIAATEGLVAAHMEGVVHRDIKPENVLIPTDVEGDPLVALSKLADLGLARADSDPSLTGTDVTMGTPGYMAPEQVEDAKRAGKPADVFGMGATLYALLGGKAPFGGKSPSDALVKTALGEYTPIWKKRRDLSVATVGLIEKCLDPDPEKRFPDAPALLKGLELCRAVVEHRATGEDATVELFALVDADEQGKAVVSSLPPLEQLPEKFGPWARPRTPRTIEHFVVDLLSRRSVLIGVPLVLFAAVFGAFFLLRRTTGSIHLSWEPTDTPITLVVRRDGDEIKRIDGVTGGAHTLDGLELGSYELEAAAEHYFSSRLALSLHAAADMQGSLSLVPHPGTLRVRSETPDVDVVVVPRGRSAQKDEAYAFRLADTTVPTTFANFPAGPILVTATRVGFAPYEQEHTLEPDGTLDVTIPERIPVIGEVLVKSDIGGFRVWIVDQAGEKLAEGATPAGGGELRLEAREGVHVLKWSKHGYVAGDADVEVAKGALARHSIRALHETVDVTFTGGPAAGTGTLYMRTPDGTRRSRLSVIIFRDGESLRVSRLEPGSYVLSVSGRANTEFELAVGVAAVTVNVQ